MRFRRWMIALALAVGLGLALALAGSAPSTPEAAQPADPVSDGPPAPEAPSGPLDPDVDEALDDLLAAFLAGGFDQQTLDAVAASGDARTAWFLADLLRFAAPGGDGDALTAAFEALTGAEVAAPGRSSWGAVTDLLIGWDLPAWPGYRELKAALFLQVEPGWAPFFADPDADIDWRLVSWGGVPIDDRPEGAAEGCPRGCIPALDDPALIPASEGDWYPDDRIVFGVVVADEAVAFPKHQMEIHEMVNITIGGRRLGIPYCTLCGSAQAYFTESAPGQFDPPVLRTSGLLIRSNKMMYDLRTQSVLDTFTGRAVSGPLLDAGVTLEQTTVVTSTWGAWKQDHPETRIVASDGGIGRVYPLDPLQGRDDDGPIFPIGPVDPRLPVQEPVVGVIAPDGTPIALPVALAQAELRAGRAVAVGDVEAHADGDGLRVTARGSQLPAHQAFWFAWSQFHPDTAVWTPLSE
ncbi:MAG TPA: DUF3179 domain-containing (seleno)protein [Egibacteraceae bacterium]|nr:DUF3179 domain-containing (seleno)protein [Egibacteraceae bacterium]